MELLRDLFQCGAVVEGIDSQSPLYTRGEPDSLVYANLFPYLRVPDTQTIADTYIMVAVDVAHISRHNPTYAKYATAIWVLAHQERMRMAGRNGTRIDFLAEQVKALLDGQRKYGFSELQLMSNREIILNEKYQYRELRFGCDDQRRRVG